MWLRRDLAFWLLSRMYEDRQLEIVVEQRFRLEDLDEYSPDRKQAIYRKAGDEGEFLLDCVHLALWRSEPSRHGHDPVDDIEDHLQRSGSAWKAVRHGHGVAGLERRVGDDIRARADNVMAVESVATTHLRAAWIAVYGRNPNPKTAVDEAALAAEAAVCPIITPGDPRPSLGKAIAAMLDAPHKWTFPLAAPRTIGDPEIGSVVAFGGLCDQLLKTQQRHADPDAGPRDHTATEGEAALHVAMTIVHLAREGLLSTSTD